MLGGETMVASEAKVELAVGPETICAAADIISDYASTPRGLTNTCYLLPALAAVPVAQSGKRKTRTKPHCP